MPTTTNKGYSIQSTGTNPGTWGTELNTNAISFIDDNLGSITSLSLSTNDVTLSSSQARSCMISCSGVLLNSVTVTNSSIGIYLIENATTGSYTLTLSDGTHTVTIPQGRRCVIFRDVTNGPRIVAMNGTSNADPIPTGTVMLFYQNAAPTGWTISSALNDYGIKIVSSAGGVVSGSVGYSTAFGGTTTGSHQLTISEMPNHAHAYQTSTTAYVINQAGSTFVLGYPASTGATSGDAGGGGSHTHPLDLRVQTASIILASRN